MTAESALVARVPVAALVIESEEAPATLILDKPVAILIAVAEQGPSGDGGGSAAGVNFTQGSPSTTWTINHNLGYRPSVDLFSTGGHEIDGGVLHTSVNQVVVSFVIPVAGAARCI